MNFGHLDGDDVGFNALDKSKCRGSHGEAVFKLGGNLHRDRLEKLASKTRQVTDSSYLLSDVTSMHVKSKFKGILRSMVTFAIWFDQKVGGLVKSRSSPWNQSDQLYSWWQDCQLGSGTSLY